MVNMIFFIECKKRINLINNVVGRNNKVHSKMELYVFLFKYGEIVDSSEISNGIDEIIYVGNQSDN